MNRVAIKGENLVTHEGSMIIESSISVAKVLVFANTKIELDFKGKKQLGENKTVFN